jgi:hypothetical protein
MLSNAVVVLTKNGPNMIPWGTYNGRRVEISYSIDYRGAWHYYDEPRGWLPDDVRVFWDPVEAAAEEFLRDYSAEERHQIHGLVNKLRDTAKEYGIWYEAVLAEIARRAVCESSDCMICQNCPGC